MIEALLENNPIEYSSVPRKVNTVPKTLAFVMVLPNIQTLNSKLSIFLSIKTMDTVKALVDEDSLLTPLTHRLWVTKFATKVVGKESHEGLKRLLK